MNTIDRTYHDEIEVERLWSATKQGEFIFFSVLPVSILFVYLLWEEASHILLLIWITVVTLINLLRWWSMQFFHTHKETIIANVSRFKWTLMVGSLSAGLWWGIGVVWFLDPLHPLNVLIMSIFVIFVSMGAMVSWFCYLPAVLAVILPVAAFFSSLLFIQGNSVNVVIGLMFLIFAMIAATGSMKLARMLNHALRLNFENVALRQRSEEQSLMLETALENMDQGISMSDQNDRLRMWNRQFTDLLGSVGDKVETDIDLTSILNAADPPLSTHAGSAKQNQLQDGRVFEVRQTELDHGGRVLTYSDISDLIKRESALEDARKTAEQANAAKTRFLAAASHDLRQPIHALGLFFGELSDRISGPENDPLIAQIDDSITSINSMLNALLDEAAIAEKKSKQPYSSLKKCNLISSYPRKRVTYKFIILTMRLHRNDTIYRSKIQPL